MRYAPEFFELALSFAERAALVTGKSVEEMLLEYTNVYKSLQIDDWTFNPENPLWKEFAGIFSESQDKLQTILDFYNRKANPEDKKKFFGVFGYDFNESTRVVRIHFKEGTSGALKKENLLHRQKEIAAVVADIRNNHPVAEKMVGISWLYNIEAYRRLFPPTYIASLNKFPNWYRSLGVWGQFLGSDGNLAVETADRFRKSFSEKSTIEDLKESFPYPVLTAEAPMEVFYEFYNGF